MEDKKETTKNQVSPEVLEKIKKDLEERKERLLSDLEKFAHQNEQADDEYMSKFPDYGSKADENAQEITEYSTNLAQEQILEKTLRDVENALARIADGTYGQCKYCKEMINEKRLLARPVASACIACKTKLQNS